jgi:hypothetical protein
MLSITSLVTNPRLIKHQRQMHLRDAACHLLINRTSSESLPIHGNHDLWTLDRILCRLVADIRLRLDRAAATRKAYLFQERHLDDLPHCHVWMVRHHYN